MTTTIELILTDQSAVFVNVPAPLVDKIQSASDCWIVAQEFMYNMPFMALLFIEAVRVRLTDEIGATFTLHELIRQRTGARYLVHGVHMEAFQRALAWFVARRICLCW